MATDKYALPDYVTARVRYYNGQFLRDDDFIDEQRYHIVERRRHERLLHVAGVTEGLVVSPAAGGSSVTITAGSAIDASGRAIRLAQDVTLPVTGSGQVYVELAFSEAETNPSDQNSSVQSNTRFTQNAQPTLSSSRTAGTVLLAELSLSSSVITAVKLDNRVYSGVLLPGPAGTGGYLRSRGDATAGWAELGCSLSVKGKLDIAAATRSGTHLASIRGLYVTGDFDAAGGVEIRHSDGKQGIGFGYNTIYAAGANTNQDLNLQPRGTGSVGIASGSLSFGSRNGQLLNLFGTAHGAGVQGSTTYFRSTKNFAFYKGGGHDDAELSAGSGGTVQLVIKDGNVGIGTSSPTSLLTIRKDAAAALGPVLTLQNSGSSPGAGAAIDWNGYDTGANDPSLRIQSLDDGKFSSSLVFYTKASGAITNKLAERMRIASDGTVSVSGGSVGVGTSAPKGPLHVVGNLVLGLDANNQKFVVHSRNGNGGDFLQITHDDGSGNWDWSKGITLERGGNVGIGTSNPTTPLTIRKDASGALGPVLTLQNSGGSAGAGASIDWNGYDPGTNDPSLRIQSLDDGQFSSSLVFYTKVPGAIGNKLKERMRIANDGTVSVSLGRVVACKEETIRVVRGFVASDASIIAGDGFTVRRVEKGLYEITFKTAFATRPSVVVTQHYPGDNEKGGSTRDNATVVVANPDRARVKTGDGDGDAQDRHFCFMAIAT